MNPTAIAVWLACGRDFAEGVALYAALGPSATYRRLFALGPTDYARQVLARELAGLLPGEPLAGPAPVLAASPAPALPAAAPTPGRVEASAALSRVQHQLRAVRDERSHLHPQLTAKGLRRTERQALAGRIVALTDQELELKAQQAHVLAHGRLPGPVPTAELTDAGELRQRLTNLRSLRSKLRRRPDRAADLAEVEATIALIQRKLSPKQDD